MHDGQGQEPREGRWRPLAFAVMVALVVGVGLAAFSGGAAAAAPSCAGDGTDFAGGDGSSGTPYEITTVEQLQCMNHTAHLGANFVLTGDVDASDTQNWNGGAGFAPIGNSSDEFTGSFDGDGYTISDLTIDRGSEFRVGLFGEVDGGSIGNVTLADVSVDGDGRVGGLVGRNAGGSVTNASASGTVSGTSRVGGLVGQTTGSGSVTDSHATVTVSGGGIVGGLVGHNFHGTVTDSYATGAVSGSGNLVGGLVGWNDGSSASVATSYATGTVSGTFGVGGLVGEIVGDASVTTSYATGAVSGNEEVGGLVGDLSHGTLTDSYATGTVSGNSDVGGLVGSGFIPAVTDSYWDVNTTNQTTSDGGTGLTTRELTGDRAEDNLAGFDFTATWTTVADSTGVAGYGVSYPVLQSNPQSPAPSSTLYAGGDGSASNPYVIADWYHLDSVHVNLDANYTLAANLDSNTAGYDLVASATANAGNGFDPIGNDSSQFQFTGSFDGQGHTISNLTVDRNGDAYVGMIGYVGAGGSVGDVTLDSATVTGSTYVGGLVGWNAGDVTTATSTGDVDGTTRVGGLVGFNDGTVSAARSHGTVNGSDAAVGGLLGYNRNGDVSNSSTTATVNGTDANVGGFVGRNEGTITDSSAAGNVTGGQDASSSRAGGFVGWNDGGSVTNSSATGAVTATGNYVGGLVGYLSGSVTASYATGTVDGTGNTNVGGLIGFLSSGSVTSSYATGSVTGNSNVGGLVGQIEGDVTDSFATGTVEGVSDVGGLIGLIDAGSVTTSYWDVNTTNQTDSDGGTDLTTTQMQRFAPSVTMTGLDFGATWNLTSAYPRLQWEGVPAITVDSLDAADATVDEDVAGTVTVTAIESGVNAGQGVTVEVTATDGLSGLTNGNTSVTDADGNATFQFNEPTPGTYNPAFAWANDTGVSDTATVTVEDVTPPTADAGPNQTVDEDVQVDFDGTASTDNGQIASYAWDFDDDGATDTGEQPSYTFADPGTYVVELTVTDGGGNIDTDTVTITVEDVTAPIADAGPNRTVDEDVAVNFDASATTDNGVIDSYEWAFGDGSPNATGVTTTHTYAEPGTYTVTLTANDSAGNEGTDTVVVTVNDTTAPTAVAGTNQTVDEDTAVSFNGSSSTDNVGIASLEWAFGDGNTNTGATVNHTYADPGTYTVTLTATDAAGNEGTDTLVVTVNDTTPPVADAGPNRTVDEDTQVAFDGSGSTDNAGIVSYAWTFGDGATATGATPTHTYTQPGTYTVNLTVTDAAGHNDTDALTVTVQADTGGSGGSVGGSGSQDTPGDDQFSFALVDGAGSTAVDGSIVSVEIVFADDATGTVTVDVTDTLPDGTNPIPTASGLAFLDVTVPSGLTDTEATMQVTLDTAAFDDVDPDDLAVYRDHEGEWRALETTVVSTSEEQIVIEATTSGFSLFAVGEAPPQTTPESTATRMSDDGTPTPEPGTPASTAPRTPDDETTTAGPGAPEPAATEDTTTASGGQPGFGAVVFLFAVLVVALLGLRRNA